MNTIYLPNHISPISEAETEKFLDALLKWERYHQIQVQWRPAIVTAVYDSDWRVMVIARNAWEISWSIPVTDRPWNETPRDAQYFPIKYLNDPTWRRFSGIAAYKFVSTPWVALAHEARTAEVLGQ